MFLGFQNHMKNIATYAEQKKMMIDRHAAVQAC